MAKLINFKNNAKWGYYNTQTHTIIPAQFQEDSDFINGFAIVKQYSNSCYGVIDEDGKEILPFIFSSIERQENGLYKAGTFYFSCLYNSKGEIVDANGIALDKRLQDYDIVKPFGKEMYLYKKGKASGVFYQDKVIVEKEDDYHYYVEIEQHPSFFELKDNIGNSLSYDYLGKLILPETKKREIFSSNFIVFSTGHYKGVENVKGETILPANYDEITCISDDLFKLTYKNDSVKYDAKKNSFIVKDAAAEIIVPRTMEWCGDFENGKAIIAIGHKYGIIDSNFNICVACNYEEVIFGYDNTAIVKDDGKFHLIDCSIGEKKVTYDEITLLSYNYFIFKKDGYYGVIGNNGSIIIPANFNKDIELLEDGCFKVSKGYSDIKSCIFDAESHIIITTPKGKFRLPQEYIWVNGFSEGLAIVENEKGLKGVINEQGELVVPCRFIGNLSDYHEGLSTVSISFNLSNKISCHINANGHFVIHDDVRTKEVLGDYQLVLRSIERNYFAYNQKWGVVDETGDVIVPFLFDMIEDFHGYYKVRKGNSVGILDINGFSGNYFGIFGVDGQEILPCKYPRIELNNNGLFEIIKTGVYGAKDEVLLSINRNGKIIVDAKGTIIELPQVYDCILEFEGKFAKVKKYNLWGLIDEGGHLIIDCKYTSVGSEFNGYFDCYEENNAYLVSLSNCTIVNLPSCKSAKYYNDNCIVLNSNKIITKERTVLFYDYNVKIGDFQNGYAIVERNEYRQRRYGLISDNGKIVIPCKYGAIKFLPDLLVAHVSEFAKNGWSVVNSKYLNVENVPVLIGGERPFVLPSQYDMGGKFVNGLAKVAKREPEKKTNDFFDIIDLVSDLAVPDLTDLDLDGVDFDNSNSLSYDDLRFIHHSNQKKYDYKWGFIDEEGNEIIPCKYDYVEDFHDGYAILVVHRHKTIPFNDRFIVSEPRYKGVISLKNEIMISPEFDDLIYLPNNLFKVKKGAKWGVIDKNGGIIIPIEYLDISSPSENLIAVKIWKDINSKDEKVWGYVNLQHEVVIKPQFSEAQNFSDGLAVVKDSIWKVINNKGDVILECPHAASIDSFIDGKSQITMQSGENSIKHTLLKNGHIIVGEQEIEIDLKSISFIGDFHNGFAKVCINIGTNKKWGFINNKGVMVISGIPNEVSDFNNGFAIYSFEGFGTQYIDIEGNLIYKEDNNIICLDRQYIAVKKLCENRFAVTRKSDCNSAVIDKFGAVIIPFCRCDFSYKKRKNSCYINEDYKYVTNEYIECNLRIYYDMFGNRIIPDPLKHVVINFNYSRTENHFSEGLAAVSNDEGLWGFVNESGQEQIPCIYDEVNDFKDGYCVVRNGFRLCVIDKVGKVILSGDFRSIEIRNEGTFFVTNNQFGHTNYYSVSDGWGGEDEQSEDINDCRKFNSNGEIVIPLHDGIVAIPKEYDWCDEEFHEGFLSVCKNKKWGVINTRLERIVECIYYDKIKFEDGIAIAKTDDVTVVINTFHTLFWGDYCDIKRYKEYNLFVCKSNQGYYDIYNGFGILLFSSTAINSRIHIPEFNKMSKDRYNPTAIIPIDNNFFKYEIGTICEKRYVGMWGICGLYGEIVLEAFFDEIGGMGSGLVSVAKAINENGRKKQLWGYVDVRGNIVVDFKYAKARPFSKGMAQVQKEKYGKWGIISTDGKELTDFVYVKFSEHSSGELLSYFQNHIESPVLITEQGAIHYQYDYGEHYGRDVFLFGYDWCSDIYHGLCIVIKDNRYGIIEETGNITFPLCEMGDVEIVPNVDGYVVFSKNEEFKEVTKEGRIITYLDGNRIDLPVGIHWCDEWTDGYIAVESNGKWGLLNTKLEFVLKTKYESIQYIGNRRVLCCLKENDKDSFFIYSIETKTILQLPYDDCSHFENGCAIVSKIMKEIKHQWTNNVDRTYAYGLIDDLGNELLPCEYSIVQFNKPIKYDNNNSDNYEEPYDWKSDYRDAFEDDPGATWGRER